MKKTILLLSSLIVSVTTSAQYSNELKVYESFNQAIGRHEQPMTIMANGNLIAHTFGWIEYIDSSYSVQKIPFLYQKERINYTDVGFAKLSSLPDSTDIKFWLCLKSPVFIKYGGAYWDTMMVVGGFTIRDLRIKSKYDYIQLQITTLKKKYYMITLVDAVNKVVYKNTRPRFLWRRRIDNKDWRTYNRQNGVWGASLW